MYINNEQCHTKPITDAVLAQSIRNWFGMIGRMPVVAEINDFCNMHMQDR